MRKSRRLFRALQHDVRGFAPFGDLRSGAVLEQNDADPGPALLALLDQVDGGPLIDIGVEYEHRWRGPANELRPLRGPLGLPQDPIVMETKEAPEQHTSLFGTRHDHGAQRGGQQRCVIHGD